MAGREEELAPAVKAAIFAVSAAAGVVGGHALWADWKIALMSAVPAAMVAFGLGLRAERWLASHRKDGG